MTYDAKILADSLSPDGVRLTTFKVTFPRIVLAEFNTHRMFSRNSASSRAIPIKFGDVHPDVLAKRLGLPNMEDMDTTVKQLGGGSDAPQLPEGEDDGSESKT